jgi:carboxymethylenebutenolidase
MPTETLTINNQFNAYLATPDLASERVTAAPGVLVVQEIFGVNSHIRSVVERFAEAGYVALAHDVFWRDAPGIELGYDAEGISRGRDLKAANDANNAVDDMRAALATLRARPECNGKVGVVGYCYGGLLTYLAATRLDPQCASSYYGGGIVDYLAEASKISMPMQFHFGEQDASIPLEHVEQIRQAVSKQETSEVFVYPAAGHGFHCDQRGSFDALSAEQAWERTLGLFKTHLA